MKIFEIEIKNYSSIKYLKFNPKDNVALIGRNNSGKSNVLKALQLFFEASITLLNKESFFNLERSTIEITVTFNKLSDWEKEQFTNWYDEDIMKVTRKIFYDDDDKIKIATTGYKKNPSVDWLKESKVSTAQIMEWWAIKDTLVVDDLDFGNTLGETKPSVGVWKEKIVSFVDEHRNELTLVEVAEENPKGYPNVLKGALPEFIYVPSVRNVTDEAKVSQTNPFGKLINSILDKLTDDFKEEVKTQLSTINSKLNREGGDERISEIKDIETRLNELMDEVLDCDLEIQIPMPELKEVFGDAKIFANDGIRTSIESKGQGLQRATIFTILRAYSEIANIKKAGEANASQRSVILTIEEPEIYLHPQLQRALMKVLRKITQGKDQAFYTTQSSHFVQIQCFDEICIVRRKNIDDIFITNLKQLTVEQMLEDLKARKGVDGTEIGMRELHMNVFNDFVNEGFFADKVVIVEGQTEEYSLPIYAEALDYDFDRNNIAVVHSEGKGEIDRILRIFNGLEIPTYVIFDGDKNNKDKDTKDKTLEILEILKEPIEDITKLITTIASTYCVFEEKWEKTINEEISDYEKIVKEWSKEVKPLEKALKGKLVAYSLYKKVKVEGKSVEDVIPPTIRKIISKIREVTYTDTYLKKLPEE